MKFCTLVRKTSQFRMINRKRKRREIDDLGKKSGELTVIYL